MEVISYELLVAGHCIFAAKSHAVRIANVTVSWVFIERDIHQNQYDVDQYRTDNTFSFLKHFYIRYFTDNLSGPVHIFDWRILRSPRGLRRKNESLIKSWKKLKRLSTENERSFTIVKTIIRSITVPQYENNYSFNTFIYLIFFHEIFIFY